MDGIQAAKLVNRSGVEYTEETKQHAHNNQWLGFKPPCKMSGIFDNEVKIARTIVVTYL